MSPYRGVVFDPVSNNQRDTYEREAILAYIRSFSFLPLKEDLLPNKMVMMMIERYKRDVGNIANMKGKTVLNLNLLMPR